MGKYLVTGGAGFIGSSLCDALVEEGHDVDALDNFDPFYEPEIKRNNLAGLIGSPNFSLLEIDITDGGQLTRVVAEGDYDVVIHLAAKAGVRPSLSFPLDYQRVTIEGTLNVLEALKDSGTKRMVFASSSSVYGNNEKVPYSESDNVDFAISPYAATKKAGEVLCHTYHHLYDISIWCLRFFTVYGPRQRPEMAIHKFTRNIHECNPIDLYGDGQSFRDYTYIDDIVEGVKAAIDRVDRYRIINLGESETTALIDLVRKLESALGKKASINWMPMQPGDVQKTYADITVARQLLDYNPQTKIDEGLTRFVQWFLDQA